MANEKEDIGCDMSRPLTDPTKDPNARCNACRWAFNRCHPGSGCIPAEYARIDRAQWSI